MRNAKATASSEWPIPVHGGGVDPIDAQLQRAMNRGDRGFIVLFASAKFPTCPTDCPGCEAV